MGGNDFLNEIERLKDHLSKRVRGQPKAVYTVANLIQDNEVLNRKIETKKRGPVGVVLFLGPSGVGKTETARALAEFYFGSEDALTKIECETLSQPHTIQTLLGAPPSYIGFDNKPLLSPEVIFKNGRDVNPKADNPDPRVQKLLGLKMELLRELKGLRREFQKNQEKIMTLNNDLLLIRDALEFYFDISRNMNADRRDPPHKPNIDMRDIEALTKMTEIELSEFSRMAVELRIKESQVIWQLSDIDMELSRLNPKLLTPADEDVENEDPMAIILFDEIEKADPAIHRLLLQIMEDGKVTLANGIESDLRNSFIILTSNVGARTMGDILKGRSIGFGQTRSGSSSDRTECTEDGLENLENKILGIAEKELEKTFPPEFRGRLDDVVVFRPLSKAVLLQIVNDQVELFCQNLLDKGISLDIDGAVKQHILDKSAHRPEVGARLLNHKIKSILKRPLARELYRRPKFSGKIRASVNKDNVEFEFTEKAE
ncbi:MAG: hypothetical protein A3B99_03135 [Candidatus Yanofskybacteria bacterium RIFCSPHIGHO2_02_FULL_44_12b]|uniref:AAA+ ATPase domain-containing protein n=2 Tax=Candidatus Yanofskyibacteriota TaxID=1752733 RepID=A0A1F8GM98_9BACT|nr:MAG: hypothetical protein UW79_C0005G0015 [Candidatus Yanofskybacteria bacterium GW2011_GWA2_44_9]OGN05515.1 MAG: hypothetical protein A2659_02910 [Candidatus Yanofskybacteria bacterium RIFCSPHIGHO2_01_FULL_44_24]OGN15066.1 MAG: hypothetical protein A3B99_03135 [Candidatus Yanofskybacteria bacterium RIFCSPHIGHO2_02_FULL_44_12b]OGN26534.1 MAG: hypothetical protein A2925_03275 [Candidatus Yanofskybacteria bacterium RIFCSPLOWO2_01_FULL_44_22]